MPSPLPATDQLFHQWHLLNALSTVNQTLPQLTDISHRLLIDPILQHCPYFVIHRIKFWAVKSPEFKCHEIWSVSWPSSSMVMYVCCTGMLSYLKLVHSFTFYKEYENTDKGKFIEVFVGRILWNLSEISQSRCKNKKVQFFCVTVYKYLFINCVIEVGIIDKPSVMHVTYLSQCSCAMVMLCRYVLECVNCGVIYRSRAHWYGNMEPEKTGLVQTKVKHVWPEVRKLASWWECK